MSAIRVVKNITATSMQMANLNIVIDKLHFAGHTDKWCSDNCNPKSFKELDNVCLLIDNFCNNNTITIYIQVDTEVCEQHFSWLSKYARMTRRMSRNVFMFFLLHTVDMHNRREESKLKRGGFSAYIA